MIEDYLENNLSSDDRYAFVEELTKNQLLQKEVHKHQIAYSIIERGIEESLRKKLDELSSKHDPDKKSDFNYPLLLVIGIVVLILLSVIFFLTRN